MLLIAIETNRSGRCRWKMSRRHALDVPRMNFIVAVSASAL